MGNTNAPAGGQGWDYVGRIDKNGVYSSVTYISNNWFITAYHIKALDNPDGVLLGGSSYIIDPVSWRRLTNSVGNDADLVMFRVVSNVGLAGLTVRSSAITNGSSLTMIGNGRNRESGETTWNRFWQEGGTPTRYTGYKWASGATKRWGTNSKGADVGLYSGGYGYNDSFYTDFDDVGGDEAQAAIYDSGGGVFYDTGSEWELAGIMFTVSTESGQPWPGTSVYGNKTYSADMQYYVSQITNIVQITDHDEDGIPDLWEYEQSGSTTGVIAAADQDSDGFSGGQEYVADTDPVDSNSFLRVDGFVASSNQVVTFIGSTNRQYRLLYTTNDLAMTNLMWMTNSAPVWGDGPNTEMTITNSEEKVFYRVEAILP